MGEKPDPRIRELLKLMEALEADGVFDEEAKSAVAAFLGRLGGLKGGPARAAKLTPERRSEIARKAVAARWAKARGESESG